MLRASSLYLVIIISTIIAILTASIISVAFFYRQEYLKSLRYHHLSSSLESGNAILLSESSLKYDTDMIFDLFDEQTDSLVLRREEWGLYDLGLNKAFVLSDTLQKALLIAKDIGNDQAAIYLSDEDRPLSITGNTQITGEVILPKSGIRAAQMEGTTYQGAKLVNGVIRNSKRELPALDTVILNRINKLFNIDNLPASAGLKGSMEQSFFKPRLTYDLSGNVQDLQNISLQGKILLVSDTTIRISRSTILKDVIICAPVILVEEGFHGSCQLFARDSIIAGKGVVFDYPSVMGIIKPDNSKVQAKIELGSESRFSGVLFSYEKKRSDLQTMISLGENSITKGEVYATGFVKMDKPLQVNGKVSCTRFIIKTPETLYENYLIDIIINRKERSKYYLTSMLFESDTMNRILKWLD